MLKFLIKTPIVLLENIILGIFPNLRKGIEKFIFNPYYFGKNHMEYTLKQFDEFLHSTDYELKEKVILELGPGGSIGFGILALRKGAKKYYAIDNGDHAQIHQKLFSAYKKLLKNDCLIDLIFNIDNNSITYKKEKVEFINIDQSSKYALLDESIDCIYSCAVLEHVHDLDLCFSEMSRVLRPGGIMNHQVDLRDHIFSQNSLWFLTISNAWFNKLFKNTGEYTNRKRLSDYTNLAKKYKLKIISLNKKSFSDLAISKKLSELYSDEDLKTSSINITLQKINAN